MVIGNPVKQVFIMDGISKDQRKKTITFSQESPKRYTIPDSFKTPPNPNKFTSNHTCSSILKNKQNNYNYNYEKSVVFSPRSAFKSPIYLNSQRSFSPSNNRYSSYGTNKNKKGLNNCQIITILTSFFAVSCVVAVSLIYS